MRGKDRHQPLDGGSLDLSLRLQHVAQAGRQQGHVLRCVVHPAAVLAFGIEKGRPGALPLDPIKGDAFKIRTVVGSLARLGGTGTDRWIVAYSPSWTRWRPDVST